MSTKKYSKVSLFIRSLVFSTCSIVSMFFYGFICLFSLPFPLRYRYKLLRLYVVFYMALLKKVCHISYEIEGLENIPDDRYGIVFSKHQSAWETFILPLIFHDPAVIAKRELIWIPFFGWGVAAADPILINRNNKISAMQQIIKKGKKCLQDKRWILVFPEGTRVPVGEVGRYHLGGARLAASTEAPVIPLAHNAGYYWPKRGFIKQPGTIKVVIGPLIESKGRQPDEIMQLAKSWIESTMLRIGGLVDKSPR